MAWPYIAPAAIMSLALVALPLVGLVAFSLFDWNLTRPGTTRFLGLGNYAAILQDTAFWRALATTAIFVVESVALQMFAGVGIALLFSHALPGMGVIRTLFLTPMMIAPIFAGMIWRLCLSDDFGAVKFILQLFGWAQPPLWLADPTFALHTVVVINSWQWIPFVVLFVLAGLQIIPRELYEAAYLDGASRFRAFVSITLPLLSPILVTVLIFRTIDAVKVFDVIYATTGGGPGDSTETISYLVYQQATNFFNLGYGSAIAVIMLFIVAALALLLVALSTRGAGPGQNS
ncbi:MAG TPA: sugar ABC transporter permease [Methylomirabilota bacterium]|nr:sugar ABC transporter permease [Methylomirabilota bacterium]